LKRKTCCGRRCFSRERPHTRRFDSDRMSRPRITLSPAESCELSVKYRSRHYRTSFLISQPNPLTIKWYIRVTKIMVPVKRNEIAFCPLRKLALRKGCRRIKVTERKSKSETCLSFPCFSAKKIVSRGPTYKKRILILFSAELCSFFYRSFLCSNNKHISQVITMINFY